MKIIKYKKLKSGKYLIQFENGTLEIYEETILKYGLLLKKNITIEEYEFLIQENRFWDCYYTAIQYIKIRSRSTYEVRSKLVKDNYLINDIEKENMK